MAMHKKYSSKTNFMNNILDEIYYPNNSICKIIPTSTEKKKNIFAEFCPASHTCLDYNISQTDTKLDAGDTKIHIQQTVADYVYNENAPPPLPRKKEKKYSSGGPSHSKFVDEIWREKQEELQKIYHKEFKIRVAERKRSKKFKMTMGHNRVMRLVGPEWYQELSPNQIATANKLKYCIYKDTIEGTIINVKENIGELGLVLRPNQAHLKKALKYCCNCPVEFLLILYQLINPNRKCYSLNDRLLLSAVVHLTMTSTLRELHIRIPSPPKPPATKKVIPKKKKQKKYESPYLEKYSFERDPPKFSGVYRNKHVQHPQSPYFCYLKSPKNMNQKIRSRRESMPTSRNGTLSSTNTKITAQDEADYEIEEELFVAQQLYEELVDFRPVPTLLKPSKYVRCYNFRTKLEQELEEARKSSPVIEEVVEDNTSTCYIPEDNVSNKRSVACICAQNVEKDQEECYTQLPQACCCTTSDDKNSNIKNETCSCGSKEVVPNITQSSCKSSTEHKRDQSPEVVKKEARCKHEKDLEIYNKYYHLIRPNTEEKFPCSCKDKHKEFIDQPLCPCKLCEEERQKKNRHFVITGLSEQPQETTTIIDRVVLEKPCKCLKQYEEEIKRYEAEKNEEAKTPCSCRKEATELVKKPQCQCERCQEDRKRKAAKLIISGTKETENENLRIIEGISTGRLCQCIQNYEKRMKEYEDFQKRKQALAEIKGQNDKYIISGVTMTPNGPAYVISGMRPPIDCACAKKAREEAERKHREEMMPHIPGGRLQYSIMGVKETPTGSVYILGNTLPIDDCDCVTVYEHFKSQHLKCTKLYNQYLLKMKQDYDDFVEEMAAKDTRKSVSEPEIKQIEPQQQSCEEEVPEVCTVESVQKTEICDCVSKAECLPTLSCTCVQPPAECCCVEEIEPVKCPCNEQVVECVNCTCAPKEEKPEIKEPKLKRFFIFDKIHCDQKWQKSVIKKALQSMAEDGYPLAKLPECHKLPHFKLWMQMRCHMFWTQNDRYKYVNKSKDLWRHYLICGKYPIVYPTLTRSEGEHLNWSKAHYCRKIVNTILEKFYRTIKQNRINSTREWFPTTFSYEFPFKSWRDCYFAYCDSKEEEVHARFVWQKYDFKNVGDMKRFCH